MKIFKSLLFVFTLFSVFHIIPIQAAKKSYVVYLGSHSHGSELSSTLDRINGIHNSHYELLGSCMEKKEKAKEAIFYSYTNYINGFAAVLDDDEVYRLSEHSEVVSVFPNGVNELDTTGTWEFLGLEKNGKISPNSLWPKAKFGEGVIIGNMDTGVWPESESFNDEGLGPIPSKWKGYCEPNGNVKCNKKLIGARYFKKGFEAENGILNSTYETARDLDGHGTHTLATAGGRFVPGANFLGSANGTAKGGSPNARVAAYKVCWRGCSVTGTCLFSGCYDADILAGFDAAIQDGVDIISISVSTLERPNYFEQAIAVGSFHAARSGILVTASAGNRGLGGGGNVANVAPWIFTVAASTIDRNFTSDVILGNQKRYKGQSFNTNTLPPKKYYPLIDALEARPANVSSDEAQSCAVLDPIKIKGKIVYCHEGYVSDLDKSLVVSRAGGIGVIFIGGHISDPLYPEADFLPTSVVSEEDGQAVLSYINSTRFPVAYISGATEYGKYVAPVMGAFSSSGPNPVTGEILKPDITAPGVNILAAFTLETAPTDRQDDNRRLPFNILYGTSMSCPHVAGIAGLLKNLYPNWSPAAIKSAIMTTATTTNTMGEPIISEELFVANPFFYGSGHVMPNRAMDPGLVYDLSAKDYLNFLCSIGYNKTEMAVFDKSYKCPSGNTSLLNFNYPTISVPNLITTVTLSRTLKNVGTPGTYTVSVEAPKNTSITVNPVSLKFSKLYEEKSFKVTIRDEGLEEFFNEFGSLTWSDGVHFVTSQIVVRKRIN